MTHSSGGSASRRDFLAAAAAVAGAGMLAGSVHAGRRQQTKDAMPKAGPRTPLKDGETIKIGVLGLGGPNGCAMGLGHCLAMVDFAKKGKENVQIAAVCDLNQLHLEHGRSEIEKEQSGVKVATYTKSRELLSRDDLHGIVIATPEHWHSLNAIDAILAGKDVYVEKPMCLNLADSVALYQVAKANPEVMAQVGTQQTQLPKYVEARKMIKSGLIGTPTFSQTSYCRNSKHGEWHYKVNPAWKPGENLDWDTWCGPLGKMPWDPKVYYQWRRYRKTSTGIIGDLLVHVMTPLMMALDQGWPTRVVATGGHLVDKDMENHDNINIAVQFETGHQMVVAGSTCNEAGLEVMIRGHKGNIYLGSRHCEFRPERIYTEEIDAQKVECADIGNDQDAHRLSWLKSIRTRQQHESNIELGMKVMVVVDLATRSMWEGGAFAFDPATMTSKKV